MADAEEPHAEEGEVEIPPIGVTPPSVAALSVNYRLVNISECKQPEFFGRALENKVLRGLLLNICVG